MGSEEPSLGNRTEDRGGFRWIRRRRPPLRGVSDIIATILLVAITVVLAAVLYILISGLTHGVGSADLGTNFGWASPVNATGASPTPVGCASANFCYQVEIASASGITTSDMSFSLHTSSGGPAGFPTGTTIFLVSTTNVQLDEYYTGNSTWQHTGITVAAADYINVNSGAKSTATNGLHGYELVALGAGPYTGTVPTSAFS
jgi:flagellin-like protein